MFRCRLSVLVRTLITVLWLMVIASPTVAAGGVPWVVYYSDKAPISAFEPYQLAVLDSRDHPPLRALADRGKILLGYISLGEVERHRSHFDAVQAEGILFDENPNWPGSYFVDVRDRRWASRVIETLIPNILRKGFHGLFLDTLDNPPELERRDPDAFKGMTEAAAVLVRAIRLHYPRIKIMMNRGYEILPEVASHIDMVLGESVRGGYDFKTKSYVKVADKDHRWQIDQLLAARKAHPGLGVFTLDYWDPEDREGIAALYREQRSHGVSPYVATIELDRIVPEPRTP